MAARAFDVKPLFAEPYFKTNIADAITPKQEKFIKNLKMLDNQVNKISVELYLFERPEMKSIKAAVQEALDTFAREVMGIDQTLAVTQSWSLMNPPGVGMHGHTHSNSLVSGSLYYTDLPDPPGNMIFERHNHYRQLEIAVNGEKQNIYNAPRNAVVPTVTIEPTPRRSATCANAWIGIRTCSRRSRWGRSPSPTGSSAARTAPS